MTTDSYEMELILRDLNTIDFHSKTFLVTGGAGFLGSWLCESLLNLGAAVLCMDNFASGREENIQYLKKRHGFSFLFQDVSEKFTIENNVDFVFHLASRASPLEFTDHPLEILKSNTIGTMNALEIAKQNNAVFLFTSTSEVYGDGNIFPTPETYHGNVNPVGIRGCYDEAKRAGEALCMAYHRQFGTDARIVRIFNTYGPRMRSDGIYGRVIPRFITQAMNGDNLTIFGDGSQTRSFCYVTDQIRGLIRFISGDDLGGTVINIGNPVEVSIQHLAQTIIRLLSSRSGIEFLPLPPDDPKRRFPDITRAREKLGWSPEISLEEGLKQLIAEKRGKNSENE